LVGNGSITSATREDINVAVDFGLIRLTDVEHVKYDVANEIYKTVFLHALTETRLENVVRGADKYFSVETK
jgi:hypothetical protein